MPAASKIAPRAVRSLMPCFGVDQRGHVKRLSQRCDNQSRTTQRHNMPSARMAKHASPLRAAVSAGRRGLIGRAAQQHHGEVITPIVAMIAMPLAVKIRPAGPAQCLKTLAASPLAIRIPASTAETASERKRNLRNAATTGREYAQAPRTSTNGQNRCRRFRHDDLPHMHRIRPGYRKQDGFRAGPAHAIAVNAEPEQVLAGQIWR
jgi:hypothetical protein